MANIIRLMRRKPAHFFLAQRLFNTYMIPHSEPGFSATQLSPGETMTVTLRSLLTESVHHLESHGFHVDPSSWTIDMHQYNLQGQPMDTPLGWHKDDINGKDVHTLILYLRKDSSLMGGNLLVRNNSDKDSEITEDDWSIKVSPSWIVLMGGQVNHKPQDLSGHGIRNSLVFQFARIDSAS